MPAKRSRASEAEDRARPVGATETALRIREQAGENRVGVGGKLLERPTDLLEPALFAQERDALGDGALLDLSRVALLAQPVRLFDELLGLVEPALEQRQLRLVHGNVPRVRGDTELLGEAPRRVELGTDARDVAPREVQLEEQGMRRHSQLAVTGGLDELDDLVREREELLQVVRAPQRNAA